MEQSRIKIVQFGAATPIEKMSKKELRLYTELAHTLGEVYGSRLDLITGACIGVPELIGDIVRKYGAKVIGYSGMTTLQDHLANPNYVAPKKLDELILIDPKDVVLNGLAERSLAMMKAGDAFLYAGGRTGTLMEYTAAIDGTDKPMLVLTGTGGALDYFHRLRIKKSRREGSEPFFTNDPVTLVESLDHLLGTNAFENVEIFSAQPNPYAWAQFSESHSTNKTVLLTNRPTSSRLYSTYPVKRLEQRAA